MASVEECSDPPSVSAGFPTSLSHFLLVVIGEPLSEDYVDLCLVAIEKGLKNWDIDGDAVEYNDVLKAVAETEANKCGLVEASFGYAGAHLGIVVLINPTSEHLSKELRGLLIHSAANKHLVFGGHTLEGCGDWVLNDDTYSLQDISDVFSESDVDSALLQASQEEKQTLVLSGCLWAATAITKQSFSKSLNLTINPQEVKNDLDGVPLLLDTIRSRIQIPSPFELMEPPTMGVGIKCKITKPTVLIFPAAKGDCAFFAVSDFSLFIGGGYSVKSCFWKFAKHLHRVDAIILPHTRPDSVIGINSLLRRKIAERQLEQPEPGSEQYEDWQIKCNSPEVGVVYLNAPENKHSPKSLVLKTVEQGNETTKLLKELSIKPFPCTANSGKEIKPITLYLKVGIGKLDMYILSPTQDSKELKDFLQQWSTGKAFSKVKTGVKVNGKEAEVTLPNACSICALIVWQPASPQENIVRVLFPGNAPQSKILEGLDRVKHLEFLKYPDAVQSSTGKISAMKKKAVSAMKKAAGSGSSMTNGTLNGKTSPTKEANGCTDGVNCNTPPPSPSGICTDGLRCNTPPPANVCGDGIHCNTPPPENVCGDGIHCNTPPPEKVCGDGIHCNTPPPENVCGDGIHCNTPPPENVCGDGIHCNTPPPENVCGDGINCNTPPPENGCCDGVHCNTPPPTQDAKCLDNLNCNTPPPEPVNVCYDGRNCNTPPPIEDNTCTDGENCNTPPPDDEYNENGTSGQSVKLDNIAAACGQEDDAFGASSDSGLPESQQGLGSDVNSNPTSPALKNIDTSRLYGTESPERLASGEITPADLVEYGMNEESDGTSSGHGTVGGTPDQPDPPTQPSDYSFPAEGASGSEGDQDVAEAHIEASGRSSPDIYPEPSSGVEMEDGSSPSERPHPWEPTIELSSQGPEESASSDDVIMDSPEIQVTEPAEIVSEARDDEPVPEQIGAQLDANCELDESSEEISQASEIEVKPSLTDDDFEDKAQGDASDVQPTEVHEPDQQIEEQMDFTETTKEESALPEADEAAQPPLIDIMKEEEAPIVPGQQQSLAPESEQEVSETQVPNEVDEEKPTDLELVAHETVATEPEADQSDIPVDEHKMLQPDEFTPHATVSPEPEALSPEPEEDTPPTTEELSLDSSVVPKAEAEHLLDDSVLTDDDEERDVEAVPENTQVEAQQDEVLMQEKEEVEAESADVKEVESEAIVHTEVSELENKTPSQPEPEQQFTEPQERSDDDIVPPVEEPIVSDSALEESAHEIVQEAVDAAVEVVEKDSVMTSELLDDSQFEEVEKNQYQTHELGAGEEEKVEDVYQAERTDLESSEEDTQEVGEILLQSEVGTEMLVPDDVVSREEETVPPVEEETSVEKIDDVYQTERTHVESAVDEDTPEVEEVLPQSEVGVEMLVPDAVVSHEEETVPPVAEEANVEKVEDIYQTERTYMESAVDEDTPEVEEVLPQSEVSAEMFVPDAVVSHEEETVPPVVEDMTNAVSKGISMLTKDDIDGNAFEYKYEAHQIEDPKICEDYPGEVPQAEITNTETAAEKDTQENIEVSPQSEVTADMLMGGADVSQEEESSQPVIEETNLISDSVPNVSEDDMGAKTHEDHQQEHLEISEDYFGKVRQEEITETGLAGEKDIDTAIAGIEVSQQEESIKPVVDETTEDTPENKPITSENDFETDVYTGKLEGQQTGEEQISEEVDVKEEAVSLTEPTISDSLEQNASDSLEDIRNEVPSDMDIPPVVEEEVSVKVEEKQESVPDSIHVVEAPPPPDMFAAQPDQPIEGVGVVEEDTVAVPEEVPEVKPEPAVEPALVSEHMAVQEASIPEEAPVAAPEPSEAEPVEKPVALQEPVVSPRVSPTPNVQSLPSTKSPTKSVKDKEKSKKPTDKGKSDSKPKPGGKTTPLSKSVTEKKTPSSTPTSAGRKPTTDKRSVPPGKASTSKPSDRKSLIEKKAGEKKPEKKASPEKNTSLKTRSTASSASKTSEKKTPTTSSLTRSTRSPATTPVTSQNGKPGVRKLNGIGDKPSSTKKSVASTTVSTARTATKKPETQRPASSGRPTSSGKKPADTTKKTTERPTRSAPSGAGHPKQNGTRKTGSATSRSSQSSKTTSIPASGPAVHVDLAYVPNHASADSVNSEFFRRLRAKNYVVSANDKARNQPAVSVLDALLEGKMKWEDSDAEVNVIPTYDYLSLREWELNKHQELSQAKIEISQPACRSIVQMKDENFFMYKVEL